MTSCKTCPHVGHILSTLLVWAIKNVCSVDMALFNVVWRCKYSENFFNKVNYFDFWRVKYRFSQMCRWFCVDCTIEMVFIEKNSLQNINYSI